MSSYGRVQSLRRSHQRTGVLGRGYRDLIARIVFILELPWELGVPDDYSLHVGSPHDVGLRFRTVTVRTQLPLAASDLAFGSLQEDADLDGSEKDRRRVERERMTDSPFLVNRTVAAAYVESEHDPPEFEEKSLSRGLARALEALNAWLISLGILLDDRLRPVAPGDLPPLVPVMPAAMVDGALQHGPSQLFSLHGGDVEVRTYDGGELEAAERILRVVVSEVGLGSFYELIQRAGSARRADRHREAVIDYGTAGELFVTAILELVGQRRAMDPVKLSNILDGPFRDRVTSLCRLLSVESDPRNPDCPLFYWWLHCYSQRNEIVHRGRDSMEVFSEMARIGTVQMVVDIREIVRADPALADIATRINWGRRVDETGGGSGSEPDPPPS